MLSKKYKSIRAGIFSLAIVLFLTAFTGMVSAEVSPKYEGKLITTHGELKAAINEAKDGDVLYVGDIDFTRTSPYAPKTAMVIEVSKSITIKSGKQDGAAVLTNGMFLLKGSKSADAIDLRFEDIVFDGAEDIDKLKWDDRLYPWDEVNGEWQYYQPTMASHALSFSGNVNATFEGCEFKNYVHEYGAVMEIYYGDYTGNEALLAAYSDQSNCRLELNFNGCSIHDNAAFYRGGAFYIEANNNVILNMNGCTIEDNVCGAVQAMSSMLIASMDGGGAVFASDAEVNMTGCEISKNECNRVFEGRELLNNYVSTRGGGIHLVRCLLNMTDCRMLENVGSMGGALALTDCKAEIDGCSFYRNRAEGRGTILERKNKGPWSNMAQGGALYVEGTANKTVSLINCSVIDNFAEVAYGGICQAEYIDPSFGVSYTKMALCTYADNTCDSSYSYADVDPMWIGFSVPVDPWASKYTTVIGSVVIDSDYGALFPRNEKPSADNDYNYFASPTQAEADGIQIDRTGDFSVKLPESDVWGIPSEVLAELVGERYDGKLTSGLVGSNYKAELYQAKGSSGEEDPDDDKDKEPKGDVWIHIGIGVALFILTCSAVGIMIARSKRSTSDAPVAEVVSSAEQEKPQKQIIIAKYSEEQIEKILSTIPEARLLTDRECEILHEMLLGKKQSEIASHLYISASTVKDFYQKIYSKMGVPNKDALLEKIFEEAKML